MTISHVLLDLDGVVRYFEAGLQTRLEEKYGLAHGALAEAAFQDDRLERLVLGKLTRTAWFDLIAKDTDCPDAAAEWKRDIGKVDERMLAEVRRLRSSGVVVAILTNGADTTRSELHDLKIAAEFDAIFNSSEIGLAKPDPRVFEYVCDALGTAPSSVFFTDDSAAKLDGAAEIGMMTAQFTTIEAFWSDLIRLGIGPNN